MDTLLDCVPPEIGKWYISYPFIADRIRSMAEGTVFTGICHSFCPQGGVFLGSFLRALLPELLPGGGCLVREGGECLVRGGWMGVWSEEVGGCLVRGLGV